MVAIFPTEKKLDQRQQSSRVHSEAIPDHAQIRPAHPPPPQFQSITLPAHPTIHSVANLFPTRTTAASCTSQQFRHHFYFLTQHVAAAHFVQIPGLSTYLLQTTSHDPTGRRASSFPDSSSTRLIAVKGCQSADLHLAAITNRCSTIWRSLLPPRDRIGPQPPTRIHSARGLLCY